MSNSLSLRVNGFLQFYNSLSSSNLSTLALLYHPDIEFIDPIHKVAGCAALRRYFSHAYEGLLSCTFTPEHCVEQGEQAMLSWQMDFSHKAIGSSKTIRVDGCSVLRWQDGLIIYHRDYYDVNAMVYRHIPVLGWLTDKVNRRLANSHKPLHEN